MTTVDNLTTCPEYKNGEKMITIARLATIIDEIMPRKRPWVVRSYDG
jgi:hypothetical protein